MKMYYEKDTDNNLIKDKKLQFLAMVAKDMHMHLI